MSLRDVIGQERAVRVLRGMIYNNRVASSYLFAGPDSVGKRYTALQLVKTLNCQSSVKGPSIESCDSCLACRKTDSLIHPDIRVIAPEGGMIKIDEIREIEEFLSFTPMEGQEKFVLIDDADSMNINAGNAFLKTLEEPPLDSIIILVSSNEEALPDTIRSRCTRILFVPLSINDIQAIVDKHGLPISEALIGLSTGNIGSLFSEDTLNVRNRAVDIFKHIIYKDSKVEPWKDRNEMNKWVEITLTILRDMAVFKINPDSKRLINPDIWNKISNICKSADLKGIIRCYETLQNLRGYLVLNLNKALVLNYIQAVLNDTFENRG